MGRINLMSEEDFRDEKRKLRKIGMTLVRNKKTGHVYKRHISTHPLPPLTKAQSIERTNFIECSKQASLWIKENGPKAYPPLGTPEYQKRMKSFKRQDKIKRFLNFVMSKM